MRSTHLVPGVQNHDVIRDEVVLHQLTGNFLHLDRKATTA